MLGSKSRNIVGVVVGVVAAGLSAYFAVYRMGGPSEKQIADIRMEVIARAMGDYAMDNFGILPKTTADLMKQYIPGDPVIVERKPDKKRMTVKIDRDRIATDYVILYPWTKIVQIGNADKIVAIERPRGDEDVRGVTLKLDVRMVTADEARTMMPAEPQETDAP